MATIKLSEREHPQYTDNAPAWDFYGSSSKGGSSFLTTENIKSHRLEESEDYTERKDRAYFLNYCDTIPKIYNSYIFKGTIKRYPDSDLAIFRESVDGKGTAMDDFIKKAGYLASIFGVVHLLVDMNTSPKKNPSKADIRNDGVAPFCSIILPTQMIDWSVDTKGNFNWILYTYTNYTDLDPTVEREEETHYKLITRDKWEVQDEDGNVVTFEDGTPSSGTNPLGTIPVYTMYHSTINDDKVGDSLIKDIVYVNRAILNWCSCIDEMIERQTFSQLVVPDDGSLSEDEDKDPLRRLSTASAWTFNYDSKHPPAFISPRADNITTIWNLVVDHIKEMFRMAGLQGGTSDLYTSRSGRQSQMNFMGVSSALAEKSTTYEKAENGIALLAYQQLGLDPEAYERAKYPTTFDIVALMEEIDSILKIMERNFSSRLNKTLMKEVARKSVPTALEGVKAEIEDEIEAGDGYVEPLSPTGNPLDPEAEAKGDGNTNTDQGNSYKSKNTKDKEDSSHRRA